MADTKISAFTDGTAPQTTDQFVVARSGANNFLTWTELLTAVKAVTLDLFAVPGANVAMNAKKLTGLAAGSGAGDSLRYEQLFAAGAVPIADLADPTTGKVIGSAGSAAAAVYPPGYEFGYDQVTSNVTVSSATEATGTTAITCAAHTFDGSPVMAEFFCADVLAVDFVVVSLFESTTQIGRLGVYSLTGATNSSGPICGKLRFTPTAASHTYTVTAFRGSTNGTLTCGAGGTATYNPMYMRFTKV